MPSEFKVVAHSRSAEIALRSGPHRSMGEAQAIARRIAQRPDIQDAHVVLNNRVVWVAENQRKNPSKRRNPERHHLQAYREGYRSGKADLLLGHTSEVAIADAAQASPSSANYWYGQGYRDGHYRLKPRFTAPAPSIPGRRKNPRFLTKEAMRHAVDGALRRSGVKFMVRTNDRLGMSVTVSTPKDRRRIIRALSKFGIESDWSFSRGATGERYRFSIDYIANVREQGDHRLNPSHPHCCHGEGYSHYQGKCQSDWNRGTGDRRDEWRRVFFGGYYAVVQPQPYSSMWQVFVYPPHGHGFIYGDTAFTPEMAKTLATRFLTKHLGKRVNPRRRRSR